MISALADIPIRRGVSVSVTATVAAYSTLPDEAPAAAAGRRSDGRQLAGEALILERVGAHGGRHALGDDADVVLLDGEIEFQTRGVLNHEENARRSAALGDVHGRHGAGHGSGDGAVEDLVLEGLDFKLRTLVSEEAREAFRAAR